MGSLDGKGQRFTGRVRVGVRGVGKAEGSRDRQGRRFAGSVSARCTVPSDGDTNPHALLRTRSWNFSGLIVVRDGVPQTVVSAVSLRYVLLCALFLYLVEDFSLCSSPRARFQGSSLLWSKSSQPSSSTPSLSSSTPSSSAHQNNFNNGVAITRGKHMTEIKENTTTASLLPLFP